MEIKLLNKLLVSKKFKIEENFKLMAQNKFQAMEEHVDFHYSKNAAIDINSWVSKETNGRIEDIVNPS